MREEDESNIAWGKADTEDLFKTWQIKFADREEFKAACALNTYADDIGHSDMILSYSDKFIRDRFAGYLSTQGYESTIINQ